MISVERDFEDRPAAGGEAFSQIPAVGRHPVNKAAASLHQVDESGAIRVVEAVDRGRGAFSRKLEDGPIAESTTTERGTVKFTIRGQKEPTWAAAVGATRFGAEIIKRSESSGRSKFE